ncbi:hypothetical protein [Pseudomonas sp. 18175]|uniref:hypothetical protein n=1 Tax=Pseudomonas sp. 18175 TaxID=3390056 RepID=UPI003D24DDF1
MNRTVMPGLCQVGATLVVMAMALLIYHRLWVVPHTRIGVIDLAAVYRAQEASFTQQVTGAATEREREAALQRVTDFAQRLPQALDELPRECRCLVVVKGAVSATPERTLNLTEALRRKVGQP